MLNSSRSKLSHLVLFFGVSGFAADLRASSTDSWSAHFQEVLKTCIQATKLEDAKAVGQMFLFPDTVGTTAIMIEGYYRQAASKGKQTKMLCLFDRATRKAYVDEGISPDAKGK